MKEVLDGNCENCVNRKRRLCEGRSNKVESDGLPPFEYPNLNSYHGFGDDDCLSKLVSVNSNGVICINYKHSYPLRPLKTMTKKQFAEFIVNLSEKDWFTMEFARCLIKRVFELKKWSDKKLTLDLTQITDRQ